jgi:hypothetical protein
MLFNYSGADSLTYREYSIICNYQNLAIVPSEATNLSYSYSYERLLPDHDLSVEYEVPLNIEIDTFTRGDRLQWSESLTFEIVNGKKKVKYHSFSM